MDVFRWQENLPEKLLAEKFMIKTGFYTDQREIINQLVQGRRLLVIQRTGWGKSLCYQLASLYYPHLTIVFSPLKALMRDQCQRCNDVYAIPSAIVSSDFAESQNRATLERARAGALKILYIAPERLGNKLWQEYVVRMRISMVVIDEAHCISVWGHDFRPDYQRIKYLISAFSENFPVLGLTATANKRVEADILAQMGNGVGVVRGTMRRPNLHLDVVQVNGDRNKLSWLAQMLALCRGTGIVYTATRKEAEMVAAFLQLQGLDAEYYHAGREDEVRQTVERRFMENGVKIVCSTNALGMGIDKRDVRFIIHYHIPASPIHYYQEMGRAGRDGAAAYCALLYDPEDLAIQRYFIEQGKPATRFYVEVLACIAASLVGMHRNEIIRITGFTQKVVQTILADLEEQGVVDRGGRDNSYIAIKRVGQVDFSRYDALRTQKLQELNDIQRYALYEQCYMQYLASYLGDAGVVPCEGCKNCKRAGFPEIAIAERMLESARNFLEKECLPNIEKHGSARLPEHEAGWAISVHGSTRIGKLVRASKYEGAGPFAEELVVRAAEIIGTRYPIGEISGIVCVPPTKSGGLVEDYSRRLAMQLNRAYLPLVRKVRATREQKEMANRLQKKENVKDAFEVLAPQLVAGQTLLLIDDIYDSGYMLREVGRTLMRAGARAVYPFTITKTAHSDDQ